MTAPHIVDPSGLLGEALSNCQDLWIGVSCDVLLAS